MTRLTTTSKSIRSSAFSTKLVELCGGRVWKELRLSLDNTLPAAGRERPRTPDRPSCRMKELKAADPRHGPLDPKVIALDALLQVLGDVMERILRHQPLFPGGRDSWRVGAGAVYADPVRREQRLVLQHL